MRALTLLAVIFFSLQTNASVVVQPKDICTHNILFLFNGTKPAIEKAKKSFFSKSDDKIMAENYKKLSSLSTNEQMNSEKALKIFKKVQPIIEKNAKNELAECTRMMEVMSKATVQACPNLKNTDPQFQATLAKCSETANKQPEVIAETEKWKKTATKLAQGR